MGENKDQKGNICLIIGALIVIVALTADNLGLGASEGFGWKQGLLLIVGIVIALGGKKYCFCKPKESSDSQSNQNQPPSSDQV